MRLQPPDSLSTLLIWVAAIFMAVREGFDQAATAGGAPLVDLSGVWSFAPLALLAVAAVRQLVRGQHAPPTQAGSVPPAPQLDADTYATFMFFKGWAIFIITLVVIAVVAAHWPMPADPQPTPVTTGAAAPQPRASAP